MIGNTIVDIWQAEGVKPVLKYEDDLKIFRYPVAEGHFSQDGFQYEYDRDEALSRISSLCVPWHKDKGVGEWSSNVVVCHGVLLCTSNVGLHRDCTTMAGGPNDPTQIFFDPGLIFLLDL
jgi:hypothetical protein